MKKLFSSTFLAAALIAQMATAEEPASPLQVGALPYPPLTGPIHGNPNPGHFDAGPIGEVYVGGFFLAWLWRKPIRWA
jgi:hypothetical protein